MVEEQGMVSPGPKMLPVKARPEETNRETVVATSKHPLTLKASPAKVQHLSDHGTVKTGGPLLVKPKELLLKAPPAKSNTKSGSV